MFSDLHVGRWQVEPSLNCIRNGRTVRRLEPQVVNLLVFLASSKGRVVSKDEIIDGVWQGRFIAETTLTRSIADLRRALGDQTQRPRYIETIPKRGYRLVAPVSGLPRGNGSSLPVGRDAYARYVEGRHHFLKGTSESLERARDCLSEAVRLDPGFVAAHVALAEFFWYLRFFGNLPPRSTSSGRSRTRCSACCGRSSTSTGRKCTGNEISLSSSIPGRRAELEMRRTRQINPSQPASNAFEWRADHATDGTT